MKKVLLCSLFFAVLLKGSTEVAAQEVPVFENFSRLVRQEDTDGDRRITVHDNVSPFEVRDGQGSVIRILTNCYPLSVLLQELKRAEDKMRAEIPMDQVMLDEPVVSRTHRLIREFYWDALTRRIDTDHVDQVVHDSKETSRYDYIYVPSSDSAAVRYFQQVEKAANERHRSPGLKVVVLPPEKEITGRFVRDLDGAHGILSLGLELDKEGRVIRGVPYVVPGGRFNELYYWDSYFIVLGLLQDGRKDLARSMVDNLVYAINHYGKVPNANRTYYLTRSQPPFLTSMARTVYEAGSADPAWLESVLKAALDEYRNVWLGSERLVQMGSYRLSRYYDSGSGPCPEVEPGHYDEKIAPWMALANSEAGGVPLTPLRFLNKYLYCGDYADLKSEGLSLDAFFKNDRAVRESGHDTTHRFDDRTADFVSVDLNSLLYRYEMDFAELLEKEFGGRLAALGGKSGDAGWWRQRAEDRKRAMIELMWDEGRGFFFDYDFVNKRRSAYISATGLYPIWARMMDPSDARDRTRVERMVACMRSKLEQKAGLAASAQESLKSARRHDLRQWDYPFGWPPHQMLVWQGLRNYGLDKDAERLAYRWLYTIARNAHDYNGTIPEKYNVVTGSHDVFAEYGNVGTKFSYITPEGFGWMNASFEVGMNYLSADRRADLIALKPPDF